MPRCCVAPAPQPVGSVIIDLRPAPISRNNCRIICGTSIKPPSFVLKWEFAICATNGVAPQARNIYEFDGT